MSRKPVVLMILDGYGLNKEKRGNAVLEANTPVMDRLMKECPFVVGNASGLAVGLPDGQMGNSEVGHLNMGAGRIVYQELTKITKAIEDGDFFENAEFLKAVVMTYPLIGNYGICREDMESRQAWPDGYIVRELSRIPSNFRSGDTIDHFLKEQDIPGISGIDTRAITKILREKGTMNGMITTNGDYDLEEVKEKIRQYTVKGVVLKTSVKKPYVLPGDGKKVALLDCGAKDNIARNLNKRGCEVTVYPADTPAEEILKTNPDGIMLSNGPGDPAENVGIIEEVRKLYESSVPIFAICLGHQLMALATGAKTYKLKYGHRGGNHPVKDLETGRVYITSQNHGYAVDEESLDPSVAVPAFVNVNDKTNEGLKYVGKNIFTVQYHPEACPGPLDSGYLFDRFMRMMEEGR